MSNDILDFVTYKERIEKAQGNLMLMYLDYRENTGSNDVDWFWDRVEAAKLELKLIKEEFPDFAVEIEKENGQ